MPYALITLCLGCQADSAADEQDSAAEGKADDLDGLGVDPADCTLDSEATRALAQFVVKDDVRFRCRGPGGRFVETGCCAQELAEFQFATGCPLQATFKAGPDGTKRCVQDAPELGESVSGELIVPTVCCELLCDAAARWDDPATRKTCRNSQGQFHPNVCCEMNDEQRCGGAEFDAAPDALGFRHCRVKAGEFEGHLAPGSCCVDSCFAQFEGGAENLPLECLLPHEDECTGAKPDTAGVCRLPEPDARFAKGLCCEGQAGLDLAKSDTCHLAALSGQDLIAAGCESAQ